MLSKIHLQAIIAAWPDDEGKSAHPEVYNEWIERCRRYDARVIQNALGVDKILGLTEKQKKLLELSLEKLLSKKDITEVSDEEILGRYELITKHVAPALVDETVKNIKARQKLH